MGGLYGKVPAHGDFVRRGLPTSFVGPWDAWLAAGIAAARERLGSHWEAAWDSAPAWRFALPAGVCGPDAVAGVMLPSQDQVGRRFPITLAALLPPGAATPAADWFDALEAAALAGRAGQADADALSAAVPPPGMPVVMPHFALPAILPGHAGEAATADDAAWAPSAPIDDGATAAPAADDVLALLGGTAAPVDAEDDALALLSGTGAPRGSEAGGADADGSLLGLIGAAPAASSWPDPGGVARNMPGLSEEAATSPTLVSPGALGDDVLAGLIGAAAPGAWAVADPVAPPAMPGELPLPETVAPAAAPSGDPDGTLMGLIGSAAEDGPRGAPDGAPLDGGTLTMLLGVAEASDPPASAPPDGTASLALADDAPASLEGLPGADPGGPPADWPDLLLGDTAPAVEDPAEAVAPMGVLAAPPAPEGGGWWTRGGAHVPPLVWPLPGLPDPADFAYLLEAAA